jgi:hypothetical protein
MAATVGFEIGTASERRSDGDDNISGAGLRIRNVIYSKTTRCF